MQRARSLPWLKPGVFVGALAPLAAILWRAAHGELGANPIAQALNQLGLVALVFLVAALACTPLKTFFGWTWPIRLRRMLGLFGFFYAVLHVSTYAGLDLGARLARHLGGRHEPQVHLRGVHRLRPADPPRGDVDQRGAQAPRIRALETTASSGLRGATPRV